MILTLGEWERVCGWVCGGVGGVGGGGGCCAPSDGGRARAHRAAPPRPATTRHAEGKGLLDDEGTFNP